MFEYLVEMPVKILFGEGKLKGLGNIANDLGTSAFILCDPFLKDSDLINRVKRDLTDHNLTVNEFYDVSPNPRNTVIDNAVQKCVSAGSDLVIAIGGGSAIDSGKAVAVVTKNGGNCWEYTNRKDEYVRIPENGKLPLIAIPTTSGTGTEATAFAVINNPEKHFKATIVHEDCFATVAIVDPEIMTTMPPQLTALTGIDAFSHAFESYTNRNATQYTDMLALTAIKLFAENIRVCVKNGKDIKARANMALASTLAGMAITHVPTTLPHGIGQPLSGLTDAPHGGSIAACIGAVIKWTLPFGEEKFAKVAEILDPSIAGLTVSEKANLLPEIITSLFNDILENSVTMSSYGLKEGQIETMADMVLKFYYIDCMGNPRIPEREDIIDIIRASM